MRRFAWPQHPQLRFQPSVGHLLAGASKMVTITLSSATPIKLDGVELKLAVTQVLQKAAGGAPQDWDDSPSRPSTAASVASAAGGNAASKLPEPAVEVVASSKRDLALKVCVGCAQLTKAGSMETARTAPEVMIAMAMPMHTPVVDCSLLVCCPLRQVTGAVDNARYSCEALPILFRPTMMFQARTFTFPLANTGLVPLRYAWRVLGASGGYYGGDGMYSVAPAEGAIPAGGSVDVTVRFAPQEVR